MDHLVNPFRSWATITDCGDIQNTPFDKLVAIRELEDGWRAINRQGPRNGSVSNAVRTVSIGGDHTISEWLSIRSAFTCLMNDFSIAGSSRSTFYMG
jgi:arginase family enzyme